MAERSTTGEQQHAAAAYNTYRYEHALGGGVSGNDTRRFPGDCDGGGPTLP